MNNDALLMMNKGLKANKQYWLVVTDLDGTLLDHDSYSFDAALPSIHSLNEKNIPIIINSSKTQAEINTIRDDLNNNHPFIIENGSAIITPKDYFGESEDTFEEACECDNSLQYKKYILGLKREKILDVMPRLQSMFDKKFISYSQSNIESIISMTGLSKKNALQSASRYYTEPVKWLGSEIEKHHFIHAAKMLGIQTLQGGRFAHLMGDTDKGKALLNIKQKYQAHYQHAVTIVALGDSHNDIAMLQAADVAVVIRSPHYAPPEFEHPNKVISELYGPEGWHECIQKLLLSNTNVL